MKTKNFLTKTFLLATMMLGGVSQMWAAAETIAYWSSAKTTQYTNDGNGNYTPTLNSSDTRNEIQVNYSSRIYFYGFDGANTAQTNRKLTAYSSNTSKKCGF